MNQKKAGVLFFAAPYCAVYAGSLYLLAMNRRERELVVGIGRKPARQA